MYTFIMKCYQTRKLSFTFSLVQWFSFKGNVYLCRTFGNVSRYCQLSQCREEGCYWLLEGRIRGCCKAQDTPPTTKTYPIQHISSFEIETHRFNGSLLSPSTCEIHIPRGLLTFSLDMSQHVGNSFLLVAVEVRETGAGEGGRAMLHSWNIGTWCVFPHTCTKSSHVGSEPCALLGQSMDYGRWAWHRLMTGNYHKSPLVLLLATDNWLQEMYGNQPWPLHFGKLVLCPNPSLHIFWMS